MSQFTRLLRIVLLLPLALAGCNQNSEQASAPAIEQPAAVANAAAVDQARQLLGTADPHQWSHYNGSYNEQRFSPLEAINATNVQDLSLAWYADYDTNQNQHGSPLYVDGVIYVSTARNVVHAFDAHDGQRLWTHTPIMIPNPNLGLVNRGLAAYNGKIYMGMLDAHLIALDANTGEPVWDAAVYDPVTDLLYFGTGNGTPWNRLMRDPDDGDNLYVASVVAVNPDTGAYVWHYQETPGDSWDYDAVSPMMTADLTFNGEQKHVVLHPSKNGMMYVLEAATGKLISGDAFTGVTWNSGIDIETDRPIEVPGARYETEPFNVGPGPAGGQIDRTTLKPHNKQSNDGWLQAWDPVARKMVWETPHAPRATSGTLATAERDVHAAGVEPTAVHRITRSDRARH